VADQETDAGLGNGGLGGWPRVSWTAAHAEPAGDGYGIHYEYGMFRQRIEKVIRSRTLITGCAMAIVGSGAA